MSMILLVRRCHFDRPAFAGKIKRTIFNGHIGQVTVARGSVPASLVVAKSPSSNQDLHLLTGAQ
jgi:hypothetical protein